jgi:hypothetical protein
MSVHGRAVKMAVLLLAALLLATACGTGTPLISEEERCTRFGGFWMQAGWCRHDGAGG